MLEVVVMFLASINILLACLMGDQHALIYYSFLDDFWCGFFLCFCFSAFP